MWVRRLSHRLMMTGPLVLVSAIAINARSGPPYENRAEFGTENHKRLMAYVGPVCAADQLSQANAEYRKILLDRTVQLWLGLADSKTLLPVMPADFDTPAQETVLNDIKTAKLNIILSLQDRANSCESDRDNLGEAFALANIIRIAAIDKYTEFATVHQFGTIQVRALERLAPLVKSLKLRDRAFLGSEIFKTVEADGRLTSIVQHTRDLHSASLLRTGVVALPIELAQSYEAMLDQTMSIGAATVSKLKTVSVVPSTMEIAGIGALAKLAVKTDLSYRQAIKSTLALLQSDK